MPDTHLAFLYQEQFGQEFSVMQAWLTNIFHLLRKKKTNNKKDVLSLGVDANSCFLFLEFIFLKHQC